MFAVRTLLTGLFGLRPAAEPRTEHARGLAALEDGRYDDACAAFTVALTALPPGPSGTRERLRSLNKRGVAHVRAGRRAEALLDFRAALELDAHFAPALVNVGNLLLEEGKLPEAIASYEAAIAGDNRYAPAYANLGVAYRRLGRYGESVHALRRATRLELIERRVSRGWPGRA